MFQSNIHWQSRVLAALESIGAPPYLIHLRIFFADTAISLNLALLLMQIPVILAAVICARKTRLMPLYALGLWLVWLIFPSSLALTTPGSFLLIAAVIWGFISIPAMATFLDSIPNHSKHLI